MTQQPATTLELRIGGRTYPWGQLHDLSFSASLGDDAKLTAVIDGAENADLGAELELIQVVGDERITQFGGWVALGTPDGETVRITARSGPWLDEGKLPGWTVQLPELEIVWTLGRLGGLAPHQINIPGFSPSLATFVVVLPIAGIELNEDVAVGLIGLTLGSAPIIQLIAFVSDSPLRTEFLSTGAWALAAVEADTAFDAERAGRAAIEAGLDRVALDELFPSVRLPDGRQRDFRREGKWTDPRSMPVALVSGRDGRQWLRSLEPWTFQVPAARASRDALRLPMIGPREFDLALTAWRRAVRSYDPIRKAVAIWEAIEHYTEGTKLRKPFTPTQRRQVRERALDDPGLTDNQREAIEEALKWLNKPTAVARLEAALIAHQFEYSQQEFEAACSLREARTSGVHGVELSVDPAALEPTLEIALGFTTRLLAQWGNRLTDSNADSNGGEQGRTRVLRPPV